MSGWTPRKDTDELPAGTVRIGLTYNLYLGAGPADADVAAALSTIMSVYSANRAAFSDTTWVEGAIDHEMKAGQLRSAAINALNSYSGPLLGLDFHGVVIEEIDSGGTPTPGGGCWIPLLCDLGNGVTKTTGYLAIIAIAVVGFLAYKEFGR